MTWPIKHSVDVARRLCMYVLRLAAVDAVAKWTVKQQARSVFVRLDISSGRSMLDVTLVQKDLLVIRKDLFTNADTCNNVSSFPESSARSLVGDP